MARDEVIGAVSNRLPAIQKNTLATTSKNVFSCLATPWPQQITIMSRHCLYLFQKI